MTEVDGSSIADPHMILALVNNRGDRGAPHAAEFLLRPTSTGHNINPSAGVFSARPNDLSRCLFATGEGERRVG
jgi:hypothetical protein